MGYKNYFWSDKNAVKLIVVVVQLQIFLKKKKNFTWEHLGGSVVEHLPLAQVVILGVLGSSLALGSLQGEREPAGSLLLPLQGACFSLCLCFCLSVCVFHE